MWIGEAHQCEQDISAWRPGEWCATEWTKQQSQPMECSGIDTHENKDTGGMVTEKYRKTRHYAKHPQRMNSERTPKECAIPQIFILP